MKTSLLHGFSKDDFFKMACAKPSFVQIELTNNCNQSCSFCFHDCKSEKNNSDLSLDKWKKCLDDLKKIGIRTIHYSGGENFLHKDFVEIIKYSNKLKFKNTINTNGTFDISPILKYSDHFIFSLHGLKDLHNKIVMNVHSFDKIEENLNLLKKSKHTVTINMVLLKSNFEEVYRLFNYLDLNFRIDKFAPRLGINTELSNEACDFIQLNSNNVKGFFKLVESIPEDKRHTNHGLHALKFYRPEENKIEMDFFTFPDCAGGKRKFVIRHNGDVYPCNFFQGEEFYCGNVFEEAISKIWDTGKGFIKFRKFFIEEQTDKSCHQCIKYQKCFSGCRAWSKSFACSSDKKERENIYGKRDVRCILGDAFIRS